jgi:hypothetical protein
MDNFIHIESIEFNNLFNHLIFVFPNGFILKYPVSKTHL